VQIGATPGRFATDTSTFRLALQIKVYNTLSTKLSVERNETETSDIFALIAAAFAMVAGALSQAWFGRVM
jgi:hypothetical protein